MLDMCLKQYSVVENPNNSKLMHTHYSYESVVKNGRSCDGNDFEVGIIDKGIVLDVSHKYTFKVVIWTLLYDRTSK